MPIGRSYTNRFNRYKGRIVRQHGEGGGGGGGVFKGYPPKYQQRGKGIGAFVVPLAKQAAYAAGGAILNAGKAYLNKKMRVGKGRGGKGRGGKGRGGKGRGSKKKAGWGARLVSAAKNRAYKAVAAALGGGGGGGGGTVAKKKRKTAVGGSRAAKVENRLGQIRKNNVRTLNKRKKQRGGTWTGKSQPNPFDIKRPPPFIGQWPTGY